MTHPPVHIVATGKAARLDFQTGSGEVAIIPDRERKAGRFTYVASDQEKPDAVGPPAPQQQRASVPDK